MQRTVSDDLWSMLAQAGVKRCYGIVGDALNPAFEAIGRHPEIEFVHVRHEEWGGFAASADARVSGGIVAVCGTAGPGVTHLTNALIDALRERARVIVIGGDVHTDIMDTGGLQEVNPYELFRPAAHFVGRVVSAKQARAVFTQALDACATMSGPAVISLPGDIAGAASPLGNEPVYRPLPQPAVGPSAGDVAALARLINAAERVTVFGGAGCEQARDLVVELAERIAAPVGFSLKGKAFLESGNPNAVGMTGLLGYGGCHEALKSADLVLLLGTDFPYPDFLSVGEAKFVQVDRRPELLGRRVPLELGIGASLEALLPELLPLLDERTDRAHLDRALKTTARWEKKLRAYVDDGAELSPIRPEFVAATINELLDDDAIVTIDTGTPVIWAAHHLDFRGQRTHLGSYSWASMANASPNAFGAWKAAPDRQVVALCGDGGFSMLAFSDLVTEVAAQAPVVHVIFHNALLDFVNIEQQEAGMVPWGTALDEIDFARVAEAFGATGIRCDDPATLKDDLRRALAHRGGPVVVDVRVDRFALAVPPGVPASTAAGFVKSLVKQAVHGGFTRVVKEGVDNARLV
ncbi:thiamine pyrophosphate-dependent enzyme [Leucobacter luti]|uniref:thiamine pyrophosphate-dependent enzyme n=1 Tax=Leucobacter luti TaxID=340320 RepID=UPI003D039F3E